MSSILVVSPVATHPAHSGNSARVRALTDMLREIGHDVYLMHLSEESSGRASMSKFWGERYIPLNYTRPSRRFRKRYRKILRKAGMESAYRYGIDEWYDPALDRALDKFKSARAVDAVLVEYVFLSRALLRFGPDVSRVIDTHDVFADRHRGYLEHGQIPQWFSCTPREETRGMNRADAVIAIQEDEAADLRRRTSARVVTVGHPVEEQPLPKSRIVPGRILTVASDNPINVQSIEWFVSEVLPSVRASHASAEVVVAGTVCKELRPRPGVRLLGRLETLADTYAEAHVVVNPMLFGTGLKIKTLEALAHGRAVVTTSSGASGLGNGARDALIVEDDARSFGEAVAGLLQDTDRVCAMGDAGIAYIREYNLGIRPRLESLFGRAST